jgi:hypothetical protein
MSDQILFSIFAFFSLLALVVAIFIEQNSKRLSSLEEKVKELEHASFNLVDNISVLQKTSSIISDFLLKLGEKGTARPKSNLLDE